MKTATIISSLGKSIRDCAEETHILSGYWMAKVFRVEGRNAFGDEIIRAVDTATDKCDPAPPQSSRCFNLRNVRKLHKDVCARPVVQDLVVLSARHFLNNIILGAGSSNRVLLLVGDAQPDGSCITRELEFSDSISSDGNFCTVIRMGLRGTDDFVVIAIGAGASYCDFSLLIQQVFTSLDHMDILS